MKKITLKYDGGRIMTFICSEKQVEKWTANPSVTIEKSEQLSLTLEERIEALEKRLDLITKV